MEIQAFQRKTLNRLIVGLILFVIAIPSIMLGDWYLVIFSVVGLFLAIKELLAIKSTSIYPLPIRWFVYGISVALVFWIFLYNNFQEAGFDLSLWGFDVGMVKLEIPTVFLTLFAGTLFFSAITDVRFKVQDATFLISVVLLIALSFQGFLYLRFFPNNLMSDRDNILNSLLLIYVGIGTFMTDIGAYFVGSLFGKYKMNVRVSKNKTWEGFYGGVLLSFLSSMAFAITMDGFGMPLLPFLRINQWYFLVGLSILIPLVATLGDFIFSIIKREFGVKHFSTLLGEHGGILDRIDSFMMACLVSSLYLTVIYDWFLALQ
jgi:phosphatidate cytidylyltransferase